MDLNFVSATFSLIFLALESLVMAISFTHKIEGETLHVVAQGFDESLQDTEAYARDVLGLALSNACTKVFCDERNLEYRLSVIDTYQLAEAASKEAASITRIGIACASDTISESGFFETVSKNRGLRIVVSPNIEKVQNWLD